MGGLDRVEEEEEEQLAEVVVFLSFFKVLSPSMALPMT